MLDDAATSAVLRSFTVLWVDPQGERFSFPAKLDPSLTVTEALNMISDEKRKRSAMLSTGPSLLDGPEQRHQRPLMLFVKIRGFPVVPVRNGAVTASESAQSSLAHLLPSSGAHIELLIVVVMPDPADATASAERKTYHHPDPTMTFENGQRGYLVPESNRPTKPTVPQNPYSQAKGFMW